MPVMPNGDFVTFEWVSARVNRLRFTWGEKFNELPEEKKTPAMREKAAKELAYADELELMK